MSFEEFYGGKGGAADRVRFGEYHTTLPKTMPVCKRVKIYFDSESRKAAFKPCEEEGFSLSVNRQLSSRAFMRRYSIPLGTIAEAKWDAEQEMLITDPLPEAKD